MGAVFRPPSMFLPSLVNASAQRPNEVCFLLTGCWIIDALQGFSPEPRLSFLEAQTLVLVEISLSSFQKTHLWPNTRRRGRVLEAFNAATWEPSRRIISLKLDARWAVRVLLIYRKLDFVCNCSSNRVMTIYFDSYRLISPSPHPKFVLDSLYHLPFPNLPMSS
jgi:hypothetical protein